MISQTDLAHLLQAHYGAVPEGADLAARLILDHTSATAEMPLAVLIQRAQAAFPLFFAKPVDAPTAREPAPEPTSAPEPTAPPVTAEPASAPVEPPKAMSLTERVAAAARSGESLPDADVRAAMASMKARSV